MTKSSIDEILDHPSGRYAFALLSGILNGIAFIWIGSFSLIANVPLICALYRSPKMIESIGLGAIVGFFAGLHIYGIAHYGWFLLITFAFYTASQMMLYGAIFSLFIRRIGPWGRLYLPVGLWILTEQIRTMGALSMPASYAGNIALDRWLAPWLYLAPYLGSLFVSGLAALVQSMLALAIIDRKQHKQQLKFALLLLLTLGLFGILNPPPLGRIEKNIIGVQSGLHNSRYQAARIDPFAEQEVVLTYQQLSSAAYEANPHYVLWPETAIRSDVIRNADRRDQLFPPKGSPITLIAGLPTQKGQFKYNAAVSIHKGEVLDEIHKVKLVMGTEDHFTPGVDFRPLKTPEGLVGVMICLEAVYPKIAQTLVKKGASFLVVMSNDAGFGYSPITHHMTRRAAMRALETGRWLVRVGQAGLSVVFNPRGETEANLELFEPALMSSTIRVRKDQTWYVRFPEMCTVLNYLGLLSLAFSLLFRRRKTPSA